jgi:tetratricopeptide (TPR) repeat protein
MLAALGAALYASGSYEEAAQRVCQASDLQPDDAAPFNFLGEMEIAAPAPLPCVETKLAGLVKAQPGNARAGYYLAMSLAKKRKLSGDAGSLSKEQALLEQAVTIDPHLGEAYQQLGIVQLEQHQAHEAATSFQNAIAANPQLVESHFRLARAYGLLGDNAQSQRELDTYERLRRQQAAEIERQRKQVRQFVIVLKDQPSASR